VYRKRKCIIDPRGEKSSEDIIKEAFLRINRVNLSTKKPTRRNQRLKKSRKGREERRAVGGRSGRLEGQKHKEDASLDKPVEKAKVYSSLNIQAWLMDSMKCSYNSHFL
jgi:hypothetical protein